ncbi:MAG: MBL fold metallo-hydrolase [Daejeonella sp.]|uniref:MBL fold metallo-hydrolase n=1 Tax=unclassified Daejeonella TaxID=2805396 RepID=UPI0023EB8515|nr:MBL fold metallo-hydrolase [Daejeonella sp. JGW-45]
MKNTKSIKKMYILIVIIVLLVFSVVIFMQQPQFGKLPTGERLERIKKSPNYHDGAFQNQSLTPIMSEGVSYFTIMKESLFEKSKRVKPVDEIPSVKTDLLHLDKNEDLLVWFGHSSYFMQIDGKKILVDPVLSRYASPLSFSIKAFKGTNNYTPEDFPEIDYLFISHDHWDHLDYNAIKKLKPKIKKVICGLGTGAHFESWGFPKEMIIEKDWNEEEILEPGSVVYTAPARHFSGRGFKRNQALWISFVLQTPTMKIYIGGDSGYDKHFAEIGKTFGPFDLAIIENGQYNENWKHVHLLPVEIVQVANDLSAKRLFTVHSSKFALGNHAWNEPLIRAFENTQKANIPLITPKIGEVVLLKEIPQQFDQWWKGIN